MCWGAFLEFFGQLSFFTPWEMETSRDKKKKFTWHEERLSGKPLTSWTE